MCPCCNATSPRIAINHKSEHISVGCWWRGHQPCSHVNRLGCNDVVSESPIHSGSESPIHSDSESPIHSDSERQPTTHFIKNGIKQTIGQVRKPLFLYLPDSK